MQNSIVPNTGGSLRAWTLALAATGFISVVQAQVQTAGDLLVNLDATTAATGPLTDITNQGTLGGFFIARGGGATIPTLANVHGNGTTGIQFNGAQYMQLVDAVGGNLIVPPAGIVGSSL